MRFFAAHKACGIYPEGVHDVLGADMEDLRAYVVSRLMWNPNLDAWTEAEEFLNGLIGAAAQPVLRAMKRLHAHVKQDHIHLSTYRRPDEVMFPRDLLDAMRADLDEAAALAGDARPAVEKMIMSLRYVELIVYGGTKPADEKRALMQTFLNDMQAFGITGIHEGGAGAEAAAKRLEQLLSDC